MSTQSVAQNEAARDVRAMLERRNVEAIQSRDVLCAICREAYGFFVSVKTGAHVCRACDRAISKAAGLPQRRLTVLYAGPVAGLDVLAGVNE